MLPMSESIDAARRYLNALTSQVVAESGRPGDRYHLGKIILQGLKNDPDFVLQIDGATGESDTCGSVLEKSIQCANSFKNYGLVVGDVVLIMAPFHRAYALPFYAALYNGLVVFQVSHSSFSDEVECSFLTSKPKVIFCQNDRIKDVREALTKTKQEALVITFDESPNSLDNFNEKYGSAANVTEFRAADFDPKETISIFLGTSGSTGASKCAAHTHFGISSQIPYSVPGFSSFPKPSKSVLAVYWSGSTLNFVLSPIYHIMRIQTSVDPVTTEHVHQMIDTCKPTMLVINSTVMASLLRTEDRSDLTCLENVFLSGNNVTTDAINEIKSAIPKTNVTSIYGSNEIGMTHVALCEKDQIVAYQDLGLVQTRLIDLDSGDDVVAANSPGEMWARGPTVFKEYYNNLRDTVESFAQAGWYKTGDVFYKDVNGNYIFVDRVKMMLRSRLSRNVPDNKQFSANVIADTIRKHPAVMDAVVMGLPDPEYGDLPLACVIRRQGYEVTADEIKSYVKASASLTEYHHLRGGVIFMTSFPTTFSGKINIKTIKEMVPNMLVE